MGCCWILPEIPVPIFKEEGFQLFNFGFQDFFQQVFSPKFYFLGSKTEFGFFNRLAPIYSIPDQGWWALFDFLFLFGMSDFWAK
jgi:hypothetical protein